MYAYAHVPLDEETITLTSFSSGDKLYAFIRRFYGLKGLPNFFTKQMYSFFQKLIDQGFALVYIDDILLLPLNFFLKTLHLLLPKTVLTFKQLLSLLNLPHITLIFLFTLLFKTSPLLLFNPL